MAKHYTRKQLKQPDEFISFSYKAWEFIKAHVMQVLVMIGVAVLIVAVAWLYTYLSDSSGSKTTAAFTRAQKIYEQPILELSGAAPTENKDDIPRFKSQPEKLKAVAAELDKLVADASGEVDTLSLLLRASVRYEQGQYTDAINDYTAFLEQTDDPSLKALAQEGLAYAYEASGSLDKALDIVRKLPREGEARFKVQFQEARLLAVQGKTKDATALFTQILEQSKDSLLTEQASARLALLDAK